MDTLLQVSVEDFKDIHMVMKKRITLIISNKNLQIVV